MHGSVKLLNNSSVFFDNCILLGDKMPLQVGHFASVRSFPSTVGIMQARQKLCSHGTTIVGLLIILLHNLQIQNGKCGLHSRPKFS